MKTSSKNFDNELQNLVGKEDFKIVKNFSTEHKKAILSASKYLEVANEINDLFWIGDKNEKTIYTNRVYRKNTGYSLRECLKKRSDFYFDKESCKNIAKHNELRKKGHSSQYEGDMLTKKGEIIPALITGIPLENGVTVAILNNLSAVDKLVHIDKVVFEAVGEKAFKTLKRLLCEEEMATVAKYHYGVRFANAMNHCFWIGGKNHRTLYVNEVYEKTTGYPLAECIGKYSGFCFDEESKKTIAAHHKLRKKNILSKYEATYITKSGKSIPVLVVGAPTEKGGSYGIHINLKEVKSLEKENLLAQQIIKHSSEATVILDQKKRVRLWSSGAEIMFGYKESEALNKKISHLILPPEMLDENEEIANEVENKSFIKNFETKRITKKGVMIDVSLSMTRVVDKNKQFIGYLIFYRDITDRKHMSDQLQKRFEAIQDAYKELGFQKRQNDYMVEITEAAISEGSIQSLGQLILSAATMITKCDGATLRLYEKKTASIELIADIGVNGSWKGRTKISFKDSLAEEAYQNNRPTIIPDLQATPKHRGQKIAKEHGFKAAIVIPLTINTEFMGSISLYSKNPEKFRLIETDFLEKFANQCALAIFTKEKIVNEKSKKTTK
jgi:PAS domain S-box-containing protein